MTVGKNDNDNAPNSNVRPTTTVAFSLLGSKHNSNKKSKKPAAAAAAVLREFTDEAAAAAAASITTTTTTTFDCNEERQTPLIIIPKNTNKSFLEQKRCAKAMKEDEANAAAEKALIQSANQHFDSMNTNTTTTNFEATGDFVISSGTNHLLQTTKTTTTNNNNNNNDKDHQQYLMDLENLPEELDIYSESYTTIPIHEFGAAMLRGMGWKEETDNSKKDTYTIQHRPHRLGLGAIPKQPSPPGTNNTNNHKLRTPSQVQRDEQQAQQYKKLQQEQWKQIQMDKQQTMQVGSLIRLEDSNKRGKLLQLSGVPGLNQVLIQVERDNTTSSVKKQSISLLSRMELEKRPFQETDLITSPSIVKIQREEGTNDTDMDDNQRKSHYNMNKQYSNASTNERKRRIDRQENNNNDNNSQENKKRNRIVREEEDDKSKQPTDGDDAKDEHTIIKHQPWIIPNIRVRIVTKKLGSSYFTQKGIILDVTTRRRGNHKATIRMDDGHVMLDHVPERYLETALPKVGGNVIVLVGKNKFVKGKLLERSLNKGVMQVFDDGSILALNLDDLAEWCRPLDDDE